VVSSVRAFPDYLPYSNEIWGGPASTYKALSDSNVDWGQELKIAKRYLDERGIKDCWFDYVSRAVNVPEYYGVTCKPLPDSFAVIFQQPPAMIPAQIEGTILISDDDASGNISGPDSLNPYDQFDHMRPDDLIAGGILVFHGKFDVSLAAARPHVFAAYGLEDEGKLTEALAEAQTAVTLAPSDVRSQIELGDVLAKLGRKDEAVAAYQRAITLAGTVHPEFQGYWVDVATWKMSSLKK